MERINENFYESEFGWSMNLPPGWKRSKRIHQSTKVCAGVESTEGDVAVLSGVGGTGSEAVCVENFASSIPSTPLGSARVATFWTALDWNLSLTWMVSGQPADELALLKFDRATMFAGRLDPEEAGEAVREIFPLVGHILSAAVVTLPDGQRALEYVETISANDDLPVRKMTYSLILPYCASFGAPVHFQKLCYMATPLAFNLQFSEIVEAARSLQFKQRAA